MVDINDFQKNIAIVLESKGVLSQFKNEDIPAPKKNVAVNEVKVKNDNKRETVEETKELVDQFFKDVKKMQMPNAADNANKKEIDAAALKLAEDPANDHLQVITHPEIVKILEAKKIKICWSCRLSNCYNRQLCCLKLKMKKRFLNKCTGRKITFKTLKESKPATPTATTQILPPPILILTVNI